MRFLLDAKDLIDAIEHNLPIALTDFDQYLRTRGRELVLTSTNVREFVAPLMTDNDFLKMRALLQSLEVFASLLPARGDDPAPRTGCRLASKQQWKQL